MSEPSACKNHLIDEKSPYLLQHADNPVDWYPWNAEAFQKAKQENKPIFLSIGYSTCHWCHVMAHESFENPDVAKVINDNFVAVKVDREERPDIDHIYMSFVTATTGHGGWPLTVFLTPDRNPFFGGTYFPPRATRGTAGLTDVLQSVHSAWSTDRQRIIESSYSITSAIREQKDRPLKVQKVDKAVLDTAVVQLSSFYDDRFGGFGMAPKFPTAHNLSFLLRYWKRTGEAPALAMVSATLTRMAGGGIYDHIGGGFHRYATDQQWQIPHFEKMLYDQAIIARAYSEAYQATRNEYFKTIARETLDYVLRELQHPGGGFYSAEDADSYDPDEYNAPVKKQLHKKEGAFFLWRFEEIKEVLGEETASIFNFYYGIKPEGNAHSDPHGEFTGKNIIYTERDITEVAAKFNRSADQVSDSITQAKRKLKDARDKRPRPHLDDKILTDWNGLMISSLALASVAFGDPVYREAAVQAAKFINAQMVSPKGSLLHRYRDGEAAIDAHIDDYAFYVYGLLDLYEATFDAGYLQQAQRLTREMCRLFEDKERGGFYFTSHEARELPYRSKELYDGAIPSGNSIAALNLVKLFHLILDKSLEDTYQRIFNAFSHEISRQPSAYTQMLIALNFALGPSCEIVIAGKSFDEIEGIRKQIFGRFLPNKIVVFNSSKDNQLLSQLAPFAAGQRMIDDKPTVYICQNQACQLPATSQKQLIEQLERI